MSAPMVRHRAKPRMAHRWSCFQARRVDRAPAGLGGLDQLV